jgi:hypothetical protein
MNTGERFDRIENSIRDLIVVSRAVLTSIEGLRAANADTLKSVQELREAQATTDEKLHILIETVDRIIRNQK